MRGQNPNPSPPIRAHLRSSVVKKNVAPSSTYLNPTQMMRPCVGQRCGGPISKPIADHFEHQHDEKQTQWTHQRGNNPVPPCAAESQALVPRSPFPVPRSRTRARARARARNRTPRTSYRHRLTFERRRQQQTSCQHGRALKIEHEHRFAAHEYEYDKNTSTKKSSSMGNSNGKAAGGRPLVNHGCDLRLRRCVAHGCRFRCSLPGFHRTLHRLRFR